MAWWAWFLAGAATAIIVSFLVLVVVAFVLGDDEGGWE